MYARTLSNGKTLTFTVSTRINTLGDSVTEVYPAIDGTASTYGINVHGDLRGHTNIRNPRAGAPSHIVGEIVTSLGIAIGATSADIAEIDRLLADRIAEIMAYRGANAKRLAREAAYDNLQNEGYSDGYNPHRTATDDGDRTPWQKGDEVPA